MTRESSQIASYREAVLRVSAYPQHLLTGVRVDFDLRFAFESRTLHGHRVRFGLVGGELRYHLNHTSCMAVHPAQEIEVELPAELVCEQTSKTALIGKGVPSIKGSSIESGVEGGTSESLRKKVCANYLQVRSGGAPSCPLWTFHAAPGSRLEGKCTSPSVEVVDERAARPLGNVVFSTSAGDWIFEPQQLSQAVSAFKRAWVRHRIMHDAKCIVGLLADTFAVLAQGEV